MNKEMMAEQLKYNLSIINTHDPSNKEQFMPSVNYESEQEYYNLRNELVLQSVLIARGLGYKAGFNVHTPIQDMIDKGWDSTWGVVAHIELPTGQVSWHLESPEYNYDGHTYEDKADRINKYVAVENA